MVRGIVVRSPTIAQGLLGRIKNIVGGQIHSFSAMCEQTRRQAFASMVEEARSRGADAIVGMRYDSSDLELSRGSATEVLCYGTAVRLRRRDLSSPPELSTGGV